jgi:hypothetical protein
MMTKKEYIGDNIINSSLQLLSHPYKSLLQSSLDHYTLTKPTK